MTAPDFNRHHDDDQEDQHIHIHNLHDFLHFYKFTSIYSAVVLTLIFAAFIVEIIYG